MKTKKTSEMYKMSIYQKLDRMMDLVKVVFSLCLCQIYLAIQNFTQRLKEKYHLQHFIKIIPHLRDSNVLYWISYFIVQLVKSKNLNKNIEVWLPSCSCHNKIVQNNQKSV